MWAYFPARYGLPSRGPIPCKVTLRFNGWTLGFTTRTVGFTLIELLVVLSILAIIASAVAITAGVADRAATIDHAFDDLEITLQSLGAKAGMARSPLWVELEPGSGRVVGRLVGSDRDQPVMDHALPGSVRVDAVDLDDQVYADHAVKLLIQPSGYLRQMRVALRLEQEQQWRLWDALDGRFVRENADG